MSDIRETEIRVFLDAVTRYFASLSADKAKVRGAYLASDKRPLHLGYTGLIAISGKYEGCVYVTAPAQMLRRILVAIEIKDCSEDNLLDAVGEIANIVAGNARTHFGELLEISVPVTIAGTPDQIRPWSRTNPYVISIEWKGYSAYLVVDIAPKTDI